MDEVEKQKALLQDLVGRPLQWWEAEVIEVRARAERLEAALEDYMQNPHCATTIVNGWHTNGFCKTCANQYIAGQQAIVKPLKKDEPHG